MYGSSLKESETYICAQKWEEHKKKRLVMMKERFLVPSCSGLALTRQVEGKKELFDRRQRDIIGVVAGCFQNFIRQDR
jgi:hypothetical protein